MSRSLKTSEGSKPLGDVELPKVSMPKKGDLLDQVCRVTVKMPDGTVRKFLGSFSVDAIKKALGEINVSEG